MSAGFIVSVVYLLTSTCMALVCTKIVHFRPRSNMDVRLAVSHKSKSGVSQPSISKQSLFSVHFHCYPAITGSLKQEKE